MFQKTCKYKTFLRVILQSYKANKINFRITNIFIRNPELNQLVTLILNPKSMTLEQTQIQVDQWIKTNGVRYFNELTNMAILTEEVGELARIIARRYGEQSEKESDKNKDLGDEMADVLWVLICLANQTGIDLTKAFEKNIEKKTLRDSDRHKQNPKLG